MGAGGADKRRFEFESSQGRGRSAFIGSVKLRRSHVCLRKVRVREGAPFARDAALSAGGQRAGDAAQWVLRREGRTARHLLPACIPDVRGGGYLASGRSTRGQALQGNCLRIATGVKPQGIEPCLRQAAQITCATSLFPTLVRNNHLAGACTGWAETVLLGRRIVGGRAPCSPRPNALAHPVLLRKLSLMTQRCWLERPYQDARLVIYLSIVHRYNQPTRRLSTHGALALTSARTSLALSTSPSLTPSTFSRTPSTSASASPTRSLPLSFFPTPRPMHCRR